MHPKNQKTGLRDHQGHPSFLNFEKARLSLLPGVWVAASFLLWVGGQTTVGAADIRGTPHNLAKSKPKVEAEEVCVFCHTPTLNPALATARGVAAPIWQPSLAAGHSFVMFDDIGRLQFGDKAAVGSQSVACLSCHDGNQAFAVMGEDFDHPFGIPYRGYVKGRELKVDEDKKEGDESAGRFAKFLKAPSDFRLPSRGMVDSRSVWWVSAKGINATRSRADLPLYARKSGDDEIPYVECSSCHDPHISNKLFLRVTNDGSSRLCLTCHDK